MFKPAWGAPQQTLSQTPLDVPEALPLSVVNISRPSQPVYLTPNVIKQELQRYPSGIFVMYHHQLGITTDAALGLVREPGLVMAHVGLPYSHVAQIQASLKQRLQEQQEQGQAPEHALVLKVSCDLRCKLLTSPRSCPPELTMLCACSCLLCLIAELEHGRFCAGALG